MNTRWHRGLLAGLCCAAGLAAAAPGEDWPTYGHDPGGQRHSPLADITPANVAQLQVAWRYSLRGANGAAPAAPTEDAASAAQRVAEATGPASRRRTRLASSQVTPLMVGDRLFLTTPYGRAVALEAATGREIWSTPVPGPGQPSLRGVEYWPGDGVAAPRIFLGTRDGRLLALDAKDGQPAREFGAEGVVNLATPEILQGGDARFYGMTSPPVVFRNLVITGAAVQEFPPRGAAGDVRAWDARTGRLVWTFHSVPRKGERFHDTWARGSAENRSGANVWGFMTVDVERGLLYLPFGAPAFDRYGGDRLGDNLFSSSLVAVDAATGRYRWHFQVVRHDIWDNDLQAPPLLFDATVAGRRVPAVAVSSKNGLLFVLDRVTGKPLHPVDYRKVPASDVPGERAAPTQPFPRWTPPLARTSFSSDEVARLIPEHTRWCERWMAEKKMVPGGLYHPVHLNQPTISFPGLQGGNNWGGGAYDPASGLLFVNTSDLGQVTELVPSTDGPLPFERGPTSGRFMQPETRLPCQQPPWGQLHAVDMATGKVRWQATLGTTDSLPEALRDTGRPNVGGPISTAGGVVFIGATDDSRFRAFDARTGQLLWTHTLGAAAHATPMTYRGADGRQYVVVAATGGSFLDSPVTADEVVAFALPRPAPAFRDPYAGKKKLLVIADLSTGNQIAHIGVSHAMAALERIGRDSDAYVAILRTDTGLVTKDEVWGTGEYAKGGRRQAPMRNLDYFDAVLFYTNGELNLTAKQKQDLLDFVAKDGKGFIGVHTAAITAASWPEYARMVGGFFDNHPWNVASAKIIVERPEAPMMKGFATGQTLVDEHYQMLPTPYSRSEVDVLARLDPDSLDLSNPGVHRTDRDFPIAWIKPYGKGRVFYSYIGHPDAAWDDPRVQTMYREAIRWAMDGGMTPQPHPLTAR
jgi:quinoprotein glucose dehydrogenase